MFVVTIIRTIEAFITSKGRQYFVLMPWHYQRFGFCLCINSSQRPQDNQHMDENVYQHFRRAWHRQGKSEKFRWILFVGIYFLFVLKIYRQVSVERKSAVFMAAVNISSNFRLFCSGLIERMKRGRQPDELSMLYRKAGHGRRMQYNGQQSNMIDLNASSTDVADLNEGDTQTGNFSNTANFSNK